MILLVILLIPFLTGLLLFPFRNAATIRSIALASSVANLGITLSLVFSANGASYTANLMNFTGIQLALGYDGISLVMILLTNLLFPFIILAGFKHEQKQVHMLYALILLTQTALLGVFLAQNALLFYIFWELSLIPVYFILLIWGGEGRRTITLKFFIYTLSGSLFLLFGIIYLYQLTPGLHTTDFSAFNQLIIPANTQIWLFWILYSLCHQDAGVPVSYLATFDLYHGIYARCNDISRCNDKNRNLWCTSFHVSHSAIGSSLLAKHGDHSEPDRSDLCFGNRIPAN